MADKLRLSDSEWRARLTPAQHRVLRRGGTERPFSHPGFSGERAGAGRYMCAGCGASLFAGTAKFDSGTGWPSFDRPIDANAVSEREDRGWFMRRTEVLCARCDGHLGHVFEDGPTSTGRRYCINGAALAYVDDVIEETGHDS